MKYYSPYFKLVGAVLLVGNTLPEQSLVLMQTKDVGAT